jgi:tetrapyrrole methylase family protein/MazG family protein/ATP diphosphatase
LSEIQRLIEVMAKLRDPEGGCPWDLEQSFETVAPYTIEEAYEVDDAIQRGDLAALRDELGDLLLQVVFHAQMAHEAGHFEFGDVVEAICEKLVRRHPHVFGDASVASARAQTDAWERHKAEERAEQGARSVLDGVPLGLPALLRAKKLMGRAARAGFAWERVDQAADKVAEELDEVRAEIASGDRDRLEAELGDLLIASARLAQQLEVDPETALRKATARFEARLRHVEAELAARGRDFSDADLEELLEHWRAAKRSLADSG